MKRKMVLSKIAEDKAPGSTCHNPKKLPVQAYDHPALSTSISVSREG